MCGCVDFVFRVWVCVCVDFAFGVCVRGVWYGMDLVFGVSVDFVFGACGGVRVCAVAVRLHRMRWSRSENENQASVAGSIARALSQSVFAQQTRAPLAQHPHANPHKKHKFHTHTHTRKHQKQNPEIRTHTAKTKQRRVHVCSKTKTKPQTTLRQKRTAVSRAREIRTFPTVHQANAKFTDDKVCSPRSSLIMPQAHFPPCATRSLSRRAAAALHASIRHFLRSGVVSVNIVPSPPLSLPHARCSRVCMRPIASL